MGNLSRLDVAGNQLSELPPEIGRLDNLTSLNLSGNRLTYLPSEIGKLSNLESLDLAGNPLKGLPPEIGNLGSLTRLVLTNNALNEIPIEIGNLCNLSSLYLYGNKLSRLPIEVGKLESLTSLDLKFNQISDLPSEVGELVKLIRLDVSGNQINGLPSEIGKLVNLTNLRIATNQLTEIPPEIGKLGNLDSLDLASNQLRGLPPEIGNLENLTNLRIATNQLTEIPPEIGKLGNLDSLDLAGNQLRGLPPEIGNLENLTNLRIATNQLTEIPPEIGKLGNLDSLDLAGNQLRGLPPEIGKLGNLTRLVFTNNQLTEIPLEIKNLGNLIHLVLTNNKLAEIPSGIGNLYNLTSLDIATNQLSEIPQEIGKLGNLDSLDLAGNQLRGLPPEIGNMSNLTRLDLDSNRLTEVLSEIGNLIKLTNLDLSKNQLNRLPIELLQLVKLKELYLHGNEKLGIPPEILGLKRKDLVISVNRFILGKEEKTKVLAKPTDILQYYFRTLQEPSLPLNQAKVILVGEGKVGKTSLVNRLMDNEFNTKEDQTKGIEIRRWPIQLENEEINLNVWDFGGQEIMHATHQFFLTKRSIYVLVLDSRQSAEANRLEYWLRMIQSFGGDSPVIVVCNQYDQQAMDLNWKGLKAKYPFILDFVRQASCKENIGIEEVRDKIQNAVTDLPHIKDLVPQTWFHVKDNLEGQKENGLDCLSIDKYRNLCESKLVTKETDQDLLVNFLNDLGVMLHYGDHQVLCDLNILNPQWVTQGVYAIINHPDLLRKRDGIVTLADLANILDKERYPAHRRRFIADMMCKFELCYSFSESQNDTYMVPSLLSENEQDTGAWDGALGLQYKYDALPAGIISRFIVRMHPYISKNTYWKNGGGADFREQKKPRLGQGGSGGQPDYDPG